MITLVHYVIIYLYFCHGSGTFWTKEICIRVVVAKVAKYTDKNIARVGVACINPAKKMNAKLALHGTWLANIAEEAVKTNV